ncbi:DUF6241 domain-containing protein [Gracilibacillus sp. S3-1-1]|uniref:DUF6241 domain-containing protein n=1 Tax=Gracilibacillus pellucidus TaxID=3095368 RepID=A0ACC6M8W2_9BACI|nr:DUF6241 domain-containing protein [Gracilibacillus sp. S3-1-1]MDX8047306.1 DUF6241 domain-containing protein [Gracilibacillus sp. S3-1-1]
MKKVVIILAILVVAVGIAIYSGEKMVNWFGETWLGDRESEASVKIPEKEENIEEMSDEKAEEKADEQERNSESLQSDLEEALDAIPEEELDLGLGDNPTEDEIISVMHNMSHQKVRAEKKWGKAPMHQKTIEQVYEVIKDSNFTKKEDLLVIVERWKDGDFSRVDKDHNYFWSAQDGTVGKAHGLLSVAEEIDYIESKY